MTLKHLQNKKTMFQISKESLEKFKVLLKKHTGKDFPDNEAYEQCQKLLSLYWVLYSKPLSQGESERIKKHLNEKYPDIFTKKKSKK